ncbi:MAG TPA: hypothetical protein VFR07_06260 [Mycobacteriales bacterium]|nr:hypothetical protein [Mycobacteriales bacterium]
MTAFTSTYTVTVPRPTVGLSARLSQAVQNHRARSRQRAELSAALSGAYGSGTRNDVLAALARR